MKGSNKVQTCGTLLPRCTIPTRFPFRWAVFFTSLPKRPSMSGCRRCSRITRAPRPRWPLTVFRSSLFSALLGASSADGCWSVFTGPATYSISIFFILRAAGRFIGGWMLERFYWTSVLALFSGLILICFVASVVGGAGVAVYLLPASGLFMSVIYPSINSKGISCFPKSEHGAIAGVILFFTCLSAVMGPLAMGAVSDAMGHAKYGFILATGFSALLFLGLFFNWVFDPTREH